MKGLISLLAMFSFVSATTFCFADESQNANPNQNESVQNTQQLSSADQPQENPHHKNSQGASKPTAHKKHQIHAHAKSKQAAQ